jgi:hypothetical protein
MGNSMKKITILLVIIFTFLFSTTSWGEWELGSKNLKTGDLYYYDKDRVRKSGKYLYVWMLMDLVELKEGYLSGTSYVQLDCSIFRFKLLKIHFYKKSMGEGNTDYENTPKGEQGEWTYPQRNSVSEILYNKVCEEHQ